MIGWDYMIGWKWGLMCRKIVVWEVKVERRNGAELNWDWDLHSMDWDLHSMDWDWKEVVEQGWKYWTISGIPVLGDISVTEDPY